MVYLCRIYIYGGIEIKILLINHLPLIGSGSGYYTLNIAKELQGLGHEVHIIIPENSIKYSKIKDLCINAVFFKRKQIIENQLNFNYPCFTTHPRSNLNFFDLTEEQFEQYKNEFRKAIKFEISTFKPDIIHSQHVWILSSVANEFNIPVVVTSHGTDIIGYKRGKKFEKEIKETVVKSKKIIAISKDNEKDVLKYFNVPKDKLEMIENGYNPNTFFINNCNKEEVLNKFDIRGKYQKIVLFAGRLAENKGIDVLLNAAKLYEDKNILTLIVGNGVLFKELQNLSKRLKLKNIKFLGQQEQEKLCKLYNIADVVVVPSREEAFGLVAIEALACGTPVIASKEGGMKEFIKPDVGMLINKDDIKSLAIEIKRVLNKKVMFNSEFIAEYAKENYSQSNFIKKLLKIYNEALKN